MNRLLCCLVVCATVFVATAAHADPQASAGVTVGGVLTGIRTGAGASVHLGARADVLFLRTHERDGGFGPYVDAVTAGFDTLELGGGLEWLIPVVAEFPIILSAGAFARHSTGPVWDPGVATTIFFGARSYNFHGQYGLGFGLFAQGRYGFGDARQADVILGAQVDLAIFALPFVLITEAIRH